MSAPAPLTAAELAALWDHIESLVRLAASERLTVGGARQLAAHLTRVRATLDDQAATLASLRAVYAEQRDEIRQLHASLTQVSDLIAAGLPADAQRAIAAALRESED